MTVAPDDLRSAALAWPQRLDSWMTEFYADSPLNIIVYRALGLATTLDVVRLGFWTSLVALGVLVAWMVTVTANNQRWRAGRLLLLSPLVAVLFTAIGSYDAFTVLAWGVALWLWRTGNRIALVFGGVLLGFQHFEQTLFGCLALVCAWAAMRIQLPHEMHMRSPAWLLPGIVVGKLLLILILITNGQSAFGRSGWIERFLLEWTKVAVVTLPYLVWSLFAGLWVLVALVFMRSHSSRGRLLLACSLAIGILSTVVSGDRPRGFVIVLLPSLALAIVAYLRTPDVPMLERRAVEVTAWLAPPLILAGKLAVNANVYDNGYVSFFWITGLGGP